MKHDDAGKVIPLDGCRNFRDLGGYGSPAGFTRYGKLYRSDELSCLSAGDVKKLAERNIKTIIDLRYDPEIDTAPDILASCEGVRYYKISLLDGINSAAGQASVTGSLPELYKSLLETAGDKIVNVFRIFSRQEEGALVFHCTAGKDRTGIIAALLLKLFGVPDEDIVFDYAQSHQNIRERVEFMIRQAAGTGVTLPRQLFLSEPQYMEELLALLKNRYNGTASYLLDRGLEEAELQALKRLFFDPVK